MAKFERQFKPVINTMVRDIIFTYIYRLTWWLISIAFEIEKITWPILFGFWLFIIPLQQRWRAQQRWRGQSNAAVRGWVSEWVSALVRMWVRHALPCGHDIDYSFSQSFSNFTCKLLMMRGGTLLILGNGVKDQDQL